ncbi:hypothetical protein CRENBAI_013595 [Crenichthys baileyi]|uniref:Uncharacterized protein n=1 Tax=Crenichthys baileyi TaxID=28760 RepID=A0AAV9RFK9_9TELE
MGEYSFKTCRRLHKSLELYGTLIAFPLTYWLGEPHSTVQGGVSTGELLFTRAQRGINRTSENESLSVRVAAAAQNLIAVLTQNIAQGQHQATQGGRHGTRTSLNRSGDDEEFDLTQAGLGKKGLTMSRDMIHEEFSELLQNEYPKMKGLTGGWLLCKATDGQERGSS